MLLHEALGMEAPPDPEPPTHIPAEVVSLLTAPRDAICSYWTAGALLAVVVIAVVLLVRRALPSHRRAHPSRARRVAGRAGLAAGWLGSATGLVVGLAIAVNAYAGYIPNVQALRITAAGWGLAKNPDTARWHPHVNAATETTGALTVRTIPGTPDEKIPDGTTWIYTPPGFDPRSDVRYPVVYLIHGSPGRPSDWFAAGQAARSMDVLLAHHLVQPMILVGVNVNGVGPSARDTECLNSTRGGSRVEDYVTRTVPAWIEANYPAIADRDHRVIGGMSSGGFCSLNLGLRNTSTYSTILSIEPFLEPGDGGRKMLATRRQYLDNSPGHYLRSLKFEQPVNLFVSEGSFAGKKAIDDATSVQRRFEERGQRVEMRIEPGQTHSWAMATASLPYGLVFASQRMPVAAGRATHAPSIVARSGGGHGPVGDGRGNTDTSGLSERGGSGA